MLPVFSAAGSVLELLLKYAPAPDAHIPILAGAAARAVAVTQRGGQVRNATDRHQAAELVGELLLEILFDAVEFHRRQEFAVR
jgi:hypothetical protein